MAFDSKGTLNKVMLIGRLGQDPELKYTPSGAAVLTISLATDATSRTPDGQTREFTEWHRVVLWRKQAEVVAQYTHKGSRLYVEGKLVTRSWDDKDGIKRYTTEIQAENIQFLEGKGEAKAAPPEAPPPPEREFHEPTQEEADDLPF